MKLFASILLFISVLLLTSSCKKIEATDCNLGTVLCSCDRTAATSNPDCRDYDAISPTNATNDCTTGGGTFSSTGLCPTANRVGTCKYTLGSEITYQRYYSANYGTAAAAAATCAYYKANCFVLSGNALCDGIWTAD